MKKLCEKSLRENIESIAQYELSECNISGMAYYVSQGGRTVYEGYFGYSDENMSKRVDDRTIYRLASMTKPITAAAILILDDRGILSIDDKAKKYIPELSDIHVVPEVGKDLGVTKTDITIKHLLSHTSGFGSSGFKPLPITTKDDVNDYLDTLRCFTRAGLDFEPFTKQSYSGFAAWDLLALILERATGRDFAEFITTEIFTPCGMTDTFFTPSEEQRSRIIAMHAKRDGKNSFDTMRDDCVFEIFPNSHKLAGAGLASTLSDYAKFAGLLLKDGTVDGKTILSKNAVTLMRTPYATKEIMPGNERWGLGVRVITEKEYPHLAVGTFGWSGAYGSHFWVDPENEITAVFMKNSRFDGGSGNKSACRFEKAVFDSFEK